MAGLWDRGGLTWWELGKRVLKESIEDEVFGRAAELAFYFLLSVFPLLLFLTSIFGYVVGESAEVRRELFNFLQAVIPSADVLALVRGTLQEIIDARGVGFSLGLFFSLWTASQAVAAIGRVLETAYEVKRRRPILKSQVIALGLTIFFSVLVTFALVLLFAGEYIAEWLAGHLAFGQAFLVVWSVLQWPVILAFLLLAFELIYNFAPGGFRRRRPHWTSPGAVVAVALWILASFGFRAYLDRLNLYTWAYGSLGTPIVLLLWFYLAGLAILVGGEVNSEIQKAGAGRKRKRRRIFRSRRFPDGRPIFLDPQGGEGERVLLSEEEVEHEEAHGTPPVPAPKFLQEDEEKA